MAYPTDPEIKAAFERNFLDQMKLHMLEHELSMYDAFMVWSLGLAQFKKSRLYQMRQENKSNED